MVCQNNSAQVELGRNDSSTFFFAICIWQMVFPLVMRVSPATGGICCLATFMVVLVGITVTLALIIFGIIKKEGEEIVKYADGKLYEQRFYEKGIKTGIHKGWWNNGNLRFEYHFNNEGEYNGEVKEWYTNGQLMKFFHFINVLKMVYEKFHTKWRM